MVIDSELHDRGEDTSRIAALSDSIFGVALKLLVLDLRITDSIPVGSLSRMVLQLWPKFFSFAVTFAVVGIVWVSHHRLLRHIVRYNRTLLGINLVLLALVVLVPVPTSLIGRFGPSRSDVQTAWILYSINAILIGLSQFWLWRYALSHNMVDKKVSARLASYLSTRILVPPAVFLVSIGVASAVPQYAGTTTLLILPGMALVNARYGRRKAL